MVKESDEPLLATSDLKEAEKRKVIKDHPERIQKNCCLLPDVFFSLTWLLGVGLMTYCAWHYGFRSLDVDYENKRKDSIRKLAKLFGIVFAITLVATQVLLHVMMRFSGTMIHVSLVAIEGLLFFAGAVAARQPNLYWPSMFLIVCSAFIVVFHVNSRKSIECAAATLEVGCDIVLTYPLLQILAFFFCVLSLAFFLVYALAVFGFYVFATEDSTTVVDKPRELAGVILAFVLYFFWTSQIFKYIIIATVGGTSQAFWYGHTAILSISEHPVLDCFGRNLTYNLGAIAFGSLFVAMIETVISFLQWLKRLLRLSPICCTSIITCVLSCLQCVLACCENALDTFNKFAFIYVGIHGYSYLLAGAKTIRLFAHHGLLAIGSDFFADILFFLNSLAIGFVAAISSLYVIEHGPEAYTSSTLVSLRIAVAVVCGFGGFSVASIVFSLVDGANKATIVQFAENSQVLAITHPARYRRISHVWSSLGHHASDAPAANEISSSHHSSKYDAV